MYVVARQESGLESHYRWSGNPCWVCHATGTRGGVAPVDVAKGGRRQRRVSRACGVRAESAFVVRVDFDVREPPLPPLTGINEVKATTLSILAEG
jgi:hypothetical protein